MPKSIESYRDLDVWRIAMDIVVEVYRVTKGFPPDERFGLTSQLRRAAVSIASNIAEGHSRLGAGEHRRFVSIARGSVGEVETQLAVAVRLEFSAPENSGALEAQLGRSSKMLFSLYRRLA